MVCLKFMASLGFASGEPEVCGKFEVCGGYKVCGRS